MLDFNENIDGEFKKLGFSNCKEMFTRVEHLFDNTYLNTAVNVENPLFRGFERIRFLFSLAEPSKDCPHYIRSIDAGSERSKPYVNAENRISVWTSVLSLPLLTKREMIEEILSIDNSIKERFGEAYKILMQSRQERIRDPDARKNRWQPPF